MHAFEIRDFGLVSGFDQRLESRFDQRTHATAQHRLLAEQICLSLFREGRLDHSCARYAQSLAV